MYNNRFISLLAAISLLAVIVLVIREANATINVDSATYSYTAWAKAVEAEASTVDLSQSPRPVVVPITGSNADQPYTMDSATRSYIAWGQAMQARNAIDSGTQSYIAWGESIEKAKLNAMDSGTRSYVAWGEALEAAGKLGELGTSCSTTSQENTFAGIDSNLDSATRSYIAWGLALHTKNDIGALCR